MTNLKKVGLTALAGTLATITAVQAADVSVSGVARMQYTTQELDTSTASESRTTDVFGQNTSITFSASGEMDNGMTGSWMHTHSGTGVFSSLVTLDMGDMGSLYMDQGNAGRQGITTIQDKVPNAGEQVWDDTGSASADHGTVAQGVANVGTGNTLGYAVSSGMMKLSAGMSYNNGSQESLAVTFSDIVEGLSVGAGMATSQNVDLTTEDDVDTVFATYTMGSITVGAQKTSVDAETAVQDIERNSYGISMAVNENLSVSYGVSDTEFDESGLKDEENSGVSASYTAGGMTLGVVHNTKDNEAGTDQTDRKVTELKLTLAF
jgi:outer membrane protein OmpU